MVGTKKVRIEMNFRALLFGVLTAVLFSGCDTTRGPVIFNDTDRAVEMTVQFTDGPSQVRLEPYRAYWQLKPGRVLESIVVVRGGGVGRAVEVLSLVGLALPGFWVAIILAAVFAVTLRIFPATGYVPPSASVSRWIWSLTLPVIALGLAGVASVAKQTRDSMKDTLAREYIRTLRASGIGQRSIVWKHALRNGAIPVVTVLGLVFVSALSSTVFVEAVFVLPGLGSMAVTATSQHDIPVIEGIALYFTVLVVIVNMLLDIVYGMLNPKVRRA